MASNAKYASHGVFIKKMNENFLGKWGKPKNAVINPIPTTKPREKPSTKQQQQAMMLFSKTFKAGFKFQQPINQKPIPNDLVQPFLYIEKVIQKHHPKKHAKPQQKVASLKQDKKQDKEDKKQKSKNTKKQSVQKLKPFITSKIVNNKSLYSTNTAVAAPPPGYANLFEYETDRKNTANLIFQKMLQAGINNVKDMYNLWNKEPRRNQGQDINIKESQFIQFIHELIPKKVTNATIKHFFELYKNKHSVPATNAAIKANNLSHAHNQNQPNTVSQPGPNVPHVTNALNTFTNRMHQFHNALNQQPKQSQATGEISIKAFSFNYAKYKKAQTQIIGIMSEKAAKDRYTQLKKYLADFLSYYPQLKVGMQSMKQYQQTLRKHFQRLYQSYKNPFEDEIIQLRAQLQKPIIKYDKEKKQKIQKTIQNYQTQNQKIHSKLTQDYNHFINSYQQAIVKNHDLLFTKRTVVHLLWPIFQREPLLTRDLIQKQIQVRQAEKQRYLQCLSDIVVEIDDDKKHLSEDCFTLGEIVQLIKMKFRNKRSKQDQQAQAFTIDSLKKLLKQIKRQFLLKFNLVAEDPDSFPCDQEIPIQILHTCFEMECTKVLFKNRIWNELIEMIPQRSIQSKLHQKTIDANTCMEYILKYFKKLDQKSALQRNKSKQISLLVQNAYNQNFGKFAQIIDKVVNNLDYFVAGIQSDPQQQFRNEPAKKKKVGFADIVDAKLAVDRGQKNLLKVPGEQEFQAAMDIIKMIHLGAQGYDSKILNKGQTNKSGWGDHQQKQQHSLSPEKAFENLQMLKSMARSYFQPQAMNTNAFDIRFYQKISEQEKAQHVPVQRIIELGNSMILSGAPPPDQIKGAQTDPLRISRFLLKTIDHDVQQQQKALHNKQYDQDIYEGVSNNYFKQKIKLENRPTRFDSEGKSKYSVLLPVGYYESYIVGQSVPQEQKWFLRPHHVETLTQNPLSKKDNIIQTQYESKLDKLGLKKRPDQHVIEQNVKRKQGLISQLEQRIHALKNEVTNARRQKDIPGHKVKPTLVNNYFNKITDGKEDKDLQLAAYEGVLYDLRRKQRQLLNKFRSNQDKEHGEPNEKWWEKKDKQFNRELRKDREIVADNSGVHRSYVQKLKNNQVY